MKKDKLSSSDVYNILTAIKNNKTNLWNGHYGDWNNFNKSYWMFKIDYYNGLSDFKSGNDEFPNNWSNFLIYFNEIFEKYNLL